MGMEQFNKENGTHIVNAGGIHYEPFGIYPGTKKKLDDLAEGDTIAIPNDTTNEARALLLLQDNGLLTLKDGAGLTATINDIKENPKKLKFQELEAEGKAPANIRFICMDANDLPTVFAPAEVSRIYLNFSDPWPKARHARRRLTSNEFFKLYDKVLTADGTVEFKTDNRPLFDFSVEELKTSELFVLDQLSYDLHNDSKMNQGNIMTEYEAKFSSMGNPICKLIAKRR